MWQLITSAVSSIFTSWVDLKKSKNEAEAARFMRMAEIEADWDLEAQRQAQYSWKDELITVVWLAPLVVAWWNPGKAMEWVAFVTELPYWYQFGLFGIMAASFGLRWYFKQQNFKLPGNETEKSK